MRATKRVLAIATLAVAALGLLPRLDAPALAAPRGSGKVVANEVRHLWPAERGRLERIGGGEAGAAAIGQTGVGTLALTSEVIDAAQRFDYVGVHWKATFGDESRVLVELRTSGDDAAWSEWRTLSEEEDMANEETNERYAPPFHVGDARYAQYRVWFLDGDTRVLPAIAVTFMDVSDLNAGPLVRLIEDVKGAWKDFTWSWSASAATNVTRILSRRDWAADESIMRWWPRYEPWKKAVVHHTVTSNAYASAAPEIRAIYYFHSISRGWGDIGYNFLVDKYGNIWQGRAGGDEVEGGHAFGWNLGTMGIAALGDFAIAPPPASLVQGLAKIIAMKFAQRGISPWGADTFTHREKDASGVYHPVTSNPPNILGHRDCTYEMGRPGGQTSCPGQFLYNQLDTIRSTAQTLVSGRFSVLPYLTTNQPRVANVGQVLPVPVTVKNTGALTIPAGGPNATRLSYRVVNAATGATVVSQGALTPLSADVPSGGQQVVTATLAVPQTAGRYLVVWDLYAQGLGWFSTLLGTATRDQWLWAVEWDVTWAFDTTPPTLQLAESRAVQVTLRNTGARTWPAANVRLSYHWVSDVTEREVVHDGNRAALPQDVLPGQQVTVTINVTAPTYPTRYRLQYDLVWEGAFWFGDKGVEPLEKTVWVNFDFRASYAAPPTLTLVPSQQATAPVTVTNTGQSTWPASGIAFVQVGTHWATAAGTTVVWDGARTRLPKDVRPGESVTLQANVKAPSATGTYLLNFDMVLEGVAWFSERGNPTATVSATVKAPTYGARYQPAPIGVVTAAAQTTVPMTLTNTGDFAWTPPSFALAYHVYDAAGRLVTWDGARTPLAGAVQPGASATLPATLVLPSTNGTYTVKWDMVHEGVTWFSAKGVPTAAQSVVVGSLTYGASYDASLTPAAVATRMVTSILVRVTNSSNFAFSAANKVFLSYHWYDANGTVVVWDGKRSPIDLAAGQSASVWAEVVGPAAPGAHRLAFDLVQEGVTWFSGKGVATAVRSVRVDVPRYGAVYAAPPSLNGAQLQSVTVAVTVTNTGSLTWKASEVRLSYHVYRNGAPLIWDGVRTPLPADLAPGRSVTLTAAVRMPSAGTYELRWDLVHEGLTWFSQQGVPIARTALTAQ